LQELNQLIGVKLLTSDFLECFGSYPQLPEWQVPVSPCRRPRLP